MSLQQLGLKKLQDVELDRFYFEERYPVASGLISALRQTLDIPRSDERKVSSTTMSFRQWVQNRWRLFMLKTECPPRCINRCRGLCRNPLAKGDPIPSGFCVCDKCCPCCGVQHG